MSPEEIPPENSCQAPLLFSAGAAPVPCGTFGGPLHPLFPLPDGLRRQRSHIVRQGIQVQRQTTDGGLQHLHGITVPDEPAVVVDPPKLRILDCHRLPFPFCHSLCFEGFHFDPKQVQSGQNETLC